MKRVALVTGGTRGIGLGIARALARDAYDLAVCGTRPAESVEQTIEELRGLGAEVLYAAADVADREARARLVNGVRSRFGRLHVLVNNAGMAPRERRDILEASEESFEEVLRTNLQGPYFLTQAVARWMIEQQRLQPAEYAACVVNVSSISATVASPNRGEYCVSKAGVAMATMLWAVRLAEFGIPVYEVRPGIIKTDMTAAVTAKYDALIAAGLLLQPRWGTSDEIGRAVAMLARGDLGYATGQVVTLDGGLTVQRL